MEGAGGAAPVQERRGRGHLLLLGEPQMADQPQAMGPTDREDARVGHVMEPPQASISTSENQE